MPQDSGTEETRSAQDLKETSRGHLVSLPFICLVLVFYFFKKKIVIRAYCLTHGSAHGQRWRGERWRWSSQSLLFLSVLQSGSGRRSPQLAGGDVSLAVASPKLFSGRPLMPIPGSTSRNFLRDTIFLLYIFRFPSHLFFFN